MNIAAVLSRHRGTGTGGGGGGGGQPVPPYLASMTLGGPNTSIITHPASGFSITQLDQNLAPFAGAPGPYTYLSSNPSVGTISGSAQTGAIFTPLSAGTTQLTVQTTNSIGQLITSSPYTMTVSAQVATSVVVTPPSASIAVSGTQQFTATVSDQAASPNPIVGATGTWDILPDHTKATISAGGLATGVLATGGTPATVQFTSGAAVGTAQLVVSASGAVTAVTALFLNTSVTPNGTSVGPCLFFVGTSYQCFAQDQTTATVTGTWGSSSTATCTITNGGVVTPVAVGASVLTFTHTGTGLTSTISVSVLLAPAAYVATDLVTYANNAAFRNAITVGAGGTGSASAKYNDAINSAQISLDATRPYMGKSTLLMKFPTGGSYCWLQGPLAQKYRRVWHLVIKRYDPGFNIIGNGAPGTANSYKDGACMLELGQVGRENLVLLTSTNPGGPTAFHPEANVATPVQGGANETDIGSLTTEFTSGQFFAELVLYESPMNSIMQRRMFRFYVGTDPINAPLVASTIIGGAVNKLGGYRPLQMNVHAMFGLNMNRTPIADLYKTVAEWYIVDGSTYGDPWGIFGTQATPTLTGISGGSLTPGDTNKTITLTGTGFTNNCYPEFSNAGIWAHTAPYNGNSSTPYGAVPITITATTITVVVDVDPNATPDGISGTVLVRNYASGVATATQSVSVGTVTLPQAPTLSNATTVNNLTLTFPYTLNAAGGVPDSLTWQYRETALGGAFIAGGTFTLTSPALGGSGNAQFVLPKAATGYDVQAASTNAGGTSAYSATVTGTTGAAATLISTGLVVDWDPDSGTDVTTDGAGVGNFADAIGSATLSQGTPAKKPILKTGVYNGHNCLRFTQSSNQNLTATAVIAALNSLDGTLYLVAKNSNNTPSANQRLFANYNFNGGSNVEGYFVNQSSGNATVQVIWGKGGSNGNQGLTLSTAMTSASGPHQLAAVFDHTTPAETPYFDGVATTAGAYAFVRQTVAPSLPSIGSDKGSANFWDGDFIRFLWYNTIHTPAQVAQNSSYLKTLYALP